MNALTLVFELALDFSGQENGAAPTTGRPVPHEWRRGDAAPIRPEVLGAMMAREFANQQALIEYAEQNGLAYAWKGSNIFAKRQRQLSPEQYEIVDVRTSRGMNQAVLFSQAILQANAPLREAMAIKRERWRVLRAKRAFERAVKQRAVTLAAIGPRKPGPGA